MNITVLCSDPLHPINSYIQEWMQSNREEHTITLARQVSEIKNNGNILFLVSCAEIIKKEIREMFGYSLVLHASDLPEGRGWSPHVWQILEGAKSLTMTLLEAEHEVDSGKIWHKKTVRIQRYWVFDEIMHELAKTQVELMNFALKHYNTVKPSEQSDTLATYYRKRTPNDSELDPHRSIEEQFDLLRVCDPTRYPAFFKLRGNTYKVYIEKEENRDG